MWGALNQGEEDAAGPLVQVQDRRVLIISHQFLTLIRPQRSGAYTLVSSRLSFSAQPAEHVISLISFRTKPQFCQLVQTSCPSLPSSYCRETLSAATLLSLLWHLFAKAF